MIVIQYAIVLGIVMLFVFIIGQFDPVSEGGYWEVFLSFTIPYAAGACIYYIDVFRTAKKQNELLYEIKQFQKKHNKKG